MACCPRLAGLLSLAVVCCLASAPAAFAQNNTYTWNTDASAATWNTASNWSPTGIPSVAGDSAIFGGIISADRTVTLSSAVAVGTIAFQDTAHSYTISGSTITLDNGANPALITMAANVGDHQRIDSSVTALSNVTVANNNTNWRLFLGSGINIGSHALTVTGAGTVVVGTGFNGISGSGGLVVMDGPGVLRLQASNSGVKYVINNGTMVTSHVSSALAAPSFTADLVTINNNATLRFEREQDSPNIGITLGTGGGRIEVLADQLNMEFGGVISGSTALTKVGAGKIAFTGTNIYTGDTIIRDGTIRLESNIAPGVAGALGNSMNAILVGDDVGANNTALLAGGTSAVTVSRDITVVANANPGASTVTIGSESGSSAASFIGTLTLNRSVVLTTGPFAPSVTFGKITGTGGVTIAGSGGAVTFTSTASDFTGTITIGAATPSLSWAGTLAISADSQLGAAANSLFFYGGTLRVTGATPVSTSRAMVLGWVNGVQPSGTVDVQNTDPTSGFTINAPITGDGPFRKTGLGILTLSGANTNGYTTFVEQGTLRVTGANVLSPNSVLSVTNGATVQLNEFSQTVYGLQNPSSGTAGTIDLGSNAATVLTIGRQGQFGPFSSDPPVFTGAITGTGNLVKTGKGLQQLSASAVSFTGTTTVRQGILEFTTGVAAAAGKNIRLGDPDFPDFDAAIFSLDKSGSGFARPFTVFAGQGTRTIGHQLDGSTHNGSTVTFSGPITLENDLQLYSEGDAQGRGATLRLSGVVGGTGGLVNIASGTTELTNDNTYTGTTTVLKGRLIIGGLSQPNAAARSSAGFIVRYDREHFIGSSFNPQTYSNAVTFPELAIHDFSPNLDRIGNVDVTLHSGKFTYSGQQNGASSESFRNLVLGGGKNFLELITPVHANITSATIDLTGGFVREPGRGTLVVVSQNTVGAPDGGDYTRVLVATAPALLGGGGAAGSTNISIIPWAYHDTSPSGSASTTTETFLTYGATGLRPLLDSEFVTELAAPGTLNNVRLIATSTTLGQDRTINSLRYGLDASGTITLTNRKLTINSGAILSTTGSSNSLTFNGGEIAFGSAEGVIQTTSLGGGNVIINSVISGSGGLTATTPLGYIELNGANTYTGPTTINGSVLFNSAASFGVGGDPIRIRNTEFGSGMTYTGAGTAALPNPIEIAPSATSIRVTNGGTLVLNGVISGSMAAHIFDGSSFGHELTYSGTGTIELRAANTYSATTSLSSSVTLGIVADNNFGNPTNMLILSGNGVLRFDAPDVTLARPIRIGAVTIDTNGFNATISSNVNGGGSGTALTKSGAGTLTMTGINTYFAPTQISGGTFRMNGVLTSFSSAGGVNVNSGGTLGGSGLIERVVTVNTGGTLAPGAGVGTLTVRSLAFGASPSAAYEWEAGASTHDKIVVTNGPLNLTRVPVTLKLYDRGLGFNVTPDQQFPLITVAGTGSITGFNPANFTVVFADTPNWSTSQYSLSVVEMGGNSVLVLSNISPVPEPTGLLAIAGLTLGLAAWRRRSSSDPRCRLVK